jgi:hypothetical protein
MIEVMRLLGCFLIVSQHDEIDIKIVFLLEGKKPDDIDYEILEATLASSIVLRLQKAKGIRG